MKNEVEFKACVRELAEANLEILTMFNPLPALTACLVLVAGCGQKGPLYLPGDPSEMQTEIPEIDPDSLPGAESADDEIDDDADKDKDKDQSDDKNH